MHYMKYTLILIAVVALGDGARKLWYDLNEAPALFSQFQYKYNRHYENEDEKERHYEAFVVNLLRINYLNSKAGSAAYDINMFTDHLVDDYTLLLGHINHGKTWMPTDSPENV